MPAKSKAGGSAQASASTAQPPQPQQAVLGPASSTAMVPAAPRPPLDPPPAIVILQSADGVCYALPRALALRMLAVGVRLSNGEGEARMATPEEFPADERPREME